MGKAIHGPLIYGRKWFGEINAVDLDVPEKAKDVTLRLYAPFPGIPVII